MVCALQSVPSSKADKWHLHLAEFHVAVNCEHHALPRRLLASYPLQPITIAIYGTDLVLANVTGFLMIVYLKRHPELCVTPISSAALRGQAVVYAITNGLYVVAIGLAWISPWVSYGMYAALLAGVMVRYARIGNPFQTNRAS